MLTRVAQFHSYLPALGYRVRVSSPHFARVCSMNLIALVANRGLLHCGTRSGVKNTILSGVKSTNARCNIQQKVAVYTRTVLAGQANRREGKGFSFGNCYLASRQAAEDKYTNHQCEHMSCSAPV